MRADGSHKTRITSQAPAYADARPTWPPNGRYSEQPTRRQIKVTALPAAVAWARARNAGGSYGSFIVFEGATAPHLTASFREHLRPAQSPTGSC